MKIFGVVLYACVVLALAEGRTRVTRDAVVGKASEAEHQVTGSETRGCPLDENQVHDYTHNHQNLLMDEAKNCVGNVEDLERLNNLTELEEYRQFFGGYCSHLPEVKKCLEGIEEKAHHCLNATKQNDIRIFLGFMWSVLDTGCANQGEPLATIVHGFEAQDDQEGPIFSQCVDEVDLKTKHVTGPMSIYHKLHELKDCLIGKIKVGGEELKTVVRSFMDGIIRDLQCVEPDHTTLVLCSTISSH